jgi:hypothetical protein
MGGWYVGLSERWRRCAKFAGSDLGYQPGNQTEGNWGQMSPLLWILIAVLVIAAIAGGITISPFLLILIAVAILIYVLVMRGGGTTRY